MENNIEDKRIAMGERIRKSREETGLTQRELGKAINIAQQSIYKFEKGIEFPTIAKLYKIAEVLNVNVTNLIEENGDNQVGWIPVDKKYPVLVEDVGIKEKASEPVQVTIKRQGTQKNKTDIDILIGVPGNKKTYRWFNCPEKGEIIAWKRLSEPYKEGK